KRIIRNKTILVVYGLCLIMFAGISVFVHGFSSMNNIRNLLVQTTILALIAGGQMFTTLLGGIDLLNFLDDDRECGFDSLLVKWAE
ncbi:MAG: hypothetical protein AB9907_01160, partial [Flexilinea sp.]